MTQDWKPENAILDMGIKRSKAMMAMSASECPGDAHAQDAIEA